MTSKSESNARSSGTTPQTKAPRRKPRTELEFLQQQADDARAAAAQTFHEIGAGLGKSVDVGAWTGEHPWIAMSTAAITGFATVALVIPSKRDRPHSRPLEQPGRA